MDTARETRGGSAPPTLAAVCGLFCEACSIYIASHEDPERLSLLSARFGQSEGETYCEGCRAQKRTAFRASCVMFACAAERDLDFCGQCPDYPCEDWKAFGRARPHRADIGKDLARIAEIGVEAWMAEARERYACPTCGTINSAYDLVCRTCGHEPGNAYAVDHRDLILPFLPES